MTRWWISWARTPRMTARPCSSATAAWCAIDVSSARSCSVKGVSRSQTSSPIARRFQRSGSRIACAPGRPSGQAMFPSSRTSAAPGRADRLHRRLHDRLERLLEVERLRDRLRDPRERLELRDPRLRIGIELRVLDRLRDLGGDRDEQVDLGLRELARLDRPDVQRAGELRPREDRHGEDRLVLVLGQVRERLEPLVEVRLGRDHDRRALGGGGARDSLAGPHPRRARHLLDARPVRRPQQELVRLLVVEVDEARVGVERLSHLARDEPEHLLEIERRVDGRDRLGQEPQVSSRTRPSADCRKGRRVGDRAEKCSVDA